MHALRWNRRFLGTLGTLGRLAVLLTLAAPLHAQAHRAEEGCARFAGHWEGHMTKGTAELAASFDFHPGREGLEGFFNAPDLRALGIPLAAVKCGGTGIHFELEGDDSSTVFDGTLAEDAISGGLAEGEAKGDFTLRRAAVPPAPYEEEEVRFRNGGVTLAGSLLLPKTPGRHPAVVFQHGSGSEGASAAASSRTSRPATASRL